MPFVSKCLLSDFSFLRAAIVLCSDVSFLERRIESDDSVLHAKRNYNYFSERRFYFTATNLFRVTIHSNQCMTTANRDVFQRATFKVKGRHVLGNG